jgi:predicted negative regulator of RcsB-dependent stress response
MKKTLIFIGIALVVGTTGWLVYRNNRNNKIDETPILYDDALKNLENI